MTSLFFNIRDDQWPLVYDEKYNVSAMGLEKLHVFDTKKWRHIIQFLKDAHLITESTLVKPNEAQKEDLLVVHTKRYLRSLKGIIKRDEFVFEICRENRIPIVMLTSGGYLRATARIIADSIINLHKKGLIRGKVARRLSSVARMNLVDERGF